MPPTLKPPEGGLIVVEVAEVASTKSAITWSFVGRTERSVLVRTTVKLVGSVETRDQVSVSASVEDHEEVLLGWVTWKACTETAPARRARRLAECIALVLGEVIQGNEQARCNE